MAMITVRAAARILEVHENTVGRYEKRGLLHAIRLPSGVRRFDPEEVQSLAAEQRSAAGWPMDARHQVIVALDLSDAEASPDDIVLAFDGLWPDLEWDAAPSFSGHVVTSEAEFEDLASGFRE